MRVIFMGTPVFAVPSFKKLVQSSHEIAAVVTRPDSPRGRGQKMASSPVKEAAIEAGVTVLQPDELESNAFRRELRSFDAALFAVVGFRILPPSIYELPPMGTINLHASLLPKYRGAAPIQWAIMHGEQETGLTTFYIQKSVDTGDLLYQQPVTIEASDTYSSLAERMAAAGADLLLKTISDIEGGIAERRKQEGEPSRAPKINPSHCVIRWEGTAESINNQVRALSPAPGAHTWLRGKKVKVYRSNVLWDKNCEGQPGRIMGFNREGVLVCTADHCLVIEELQIEGKKRMDAAAFVRGARLEIGESLDCG